MINEKIYRIGIPAELYNKEIIHRFQLPRPSGFDFLTASDHRDFKAMVYLVSKNKRKYRGYRNILISYPKRITKMYETLTNIPRFVKIKP